MKKHANLAFFVPHNGCPQQCLFCNQNRISGADSTSTPQQVRAQCEAFLPAAGGGARPTEIAFFGGIDKCRFKNKVRPGDKLRLETKIIKRKGPVGVGEATATVDGRVVAKAELTFMIG